jgi:acyl dehydratase
MHYSRLPALGPVYMRLLFDRRPGEMPINTSAGRLDAALDDLHVNEAHLSAYQAICGFESGSTLPITYPHIIVASLHLKMLLAPEFPVRLTGLVHLWNKIRQYQAIEASERLDCRCWLEGNRRIEAGDEFCLNTEFFVGGQLRWEEQTGFVALRRKRARRSNSVADEAVDYPQIATWQAASNMGRRYARISGDYNPIHLSRLSARLFGFESPIAHGMWTLARSAALLGTGNGLPTELEARFLRPVPLPATISLSAIDQEQNNFFQLTVNNDQRVCVQGSVTAI